MANYDKFDLNNFPDNIFKDMFNEHSAIMMLIESKTGAIIDCNQAAVNFYGYKRVDMKEMNITDINTLDSNEIQQKIKSILDREKNKFVFKHILSNGEVCEVEVFSVPIDIGERKILFSIVNDISEKYTLRENMGTNEEENNDVIQKLKDKNREYETVFNNTQDALFLINVNNGEFRYHKLNKTHEKLTGLKNENITGKHHLKLWEKIWELR